MLSEETFIQAFWHLALVVGFLLLIIVPAAIYEWRATRRNYRDLHSLTAARHRWEEMRRGDIRFHWKHD